MLNWLSKLFRRRHEAQPQRRSASPVRVVLDEKMISVDDGAGSVASIAWSNLASVTVITTGAGPLEIDLFWILADKDGRTSIKVPMDANGEHALLKAMQSRLPAFDNMAVVEAMSSTDDAVFQVWPADEIA